MHRLPLSWHTLAPETWKNGGGSTRTLAVSSGKVGATRTTQDIDTKPGATRTAEDIDAPANWRVSIAAIVRDGAYSSFSGYQRVSIVLSGAGVVLRHEDTTIELLPGIPTVFDGAPAWQSTLIDGPVSVLNLFARQGNVEAVVAHERGLSDDSTEVRLDTQFALSHPQAQPLVWTRIVVATAAQQYQRDDGLAPLALQGNEFWIESHTCLAPHLGLHAIVISLREHCPL